MKKLTHGHYTVAIKLVAMLYFAPVFGGEDTISDKQALQVLETQVLGDPEKGINPLTPEEMRAFKRVLQKEKTKSDYDPVLDDAAKLLLQMTPDQIKKMRLMLDEKQKAENEPVKTVKPVTSSVPVDLSPGAIIPLVRLARDNSSSLIFMDATGQPWPVASYDTSIVSAFEVTAPPSQKHVLKISPKKAHVQGNLSVSLQGLHVPVVIQLIEGSDKVDYRKEFHIAALGPNAKAVRDSANINDKVLLDFLDGVPPTQAKAVKTDNKQIKVWELEGILYVRTNALLLLPAPMASRGSSDGTMVYKAPKLPALSLSIEGRTTQVRIYD